MDISGKQYLFTTDFLIFLSDNVCWAIFVKRGGARDRRPPPPDRLWAYPREKLPPVRTGLNSEITIKDLMSFHCTVEIVSICLRAIRYLFIT